MQKSRSIRHFLSLALLVVFFCASTLATAHAHAKSSDEHVHSCAVCQNSNHQAPSLHSPELVPWVALHSSFIQPDAYGVFLPALSHQALPIRGPPAA